MKQTFLALVLIMGGSTYQYAPTIDEAVERVKKRTKADWGSLFKFKRGTNLTVNVFDVTDVPDGAEVWWDDRGVHSGGRTIPLLEKRVVTY